MAIFDEEKQKKKLEEIHKREEEESTQILAEKYKIPYADLSNITVDLDYLKLIPEEKSQEGKIVIFQGMGKKIKAGLQNPNLELTQNLLKEIQKKDYQTETYLVSSSSIKKVQERYKEVPEFVEMQKGTIDISPERMKEFLAQTTTIDKLKEKFLERTASKTNRKISELLEIMLSGALGVNASDIHIEPQKKDIRLRLRLDGVLHDILNFSHRPYQLLLSRIKLISGMKLNIKEKAQDGRFTIKTQEAEIEVRSSIIPGPYGESIVLRVLNPKKISVAFEELGMHPHLQQIIEKEIKKPNGMILTTGPTGSGKTTTLYAFLKKIRSPEVKIITIEDPIEYHLENITQTQTNISKGYTFATGLRSILRQDPDIIMVGEIRDIEAATVALNAALTGHLVFSTLHTNDAAGTIPRLIDLGSNPTIIAPAINISLAQRLARKLCPECRIEYEPTKEEKIIIEKVLNSFPKQIKKPDTKNLKLFKAKGCEKCNNIGYKRRIGIFEAILIDEKLEELILKKPSEKDIKKASAKQGILNMGQDAILKIADGITSFEEIRRVIEISSSKSPGNNF